MIFIYTMPITYDEEDNTAELAIVGLGPGGLAAALEAAKLGKSVLAFTDRDSYTRSQRVNLNMDTEAFLKNHTNDKDPLDIEFWKKLDRERSVQIKDVERFLYRKLTQYPNVQVVTLKKPTNINRVERSPLNTSNQIQLSNGQSYFCHHLLASDGAKHQIANLVSQHFDTNINYQATPLQERHRYHAAVQLSLNKKSILPSWTSPMGFIKKMLAYVKLGWSESYKPKFYVLANQDKSKFSFAGEIPEAIYREPDPDKKKQQLKAWASIAIQEQFGINPDHLSFRDSKKSPAKNNFQATAFEMELQTSNTPIIELNNGVFAQTGDARRTPNYFLGHGLNDAIQGGYAFAQAIKKDGFDIDSYVDEIEKIDRHITREMESTERGSATIKTQAPTQFTAAIDALITHLARDPLKNGQAIPRLMMIKSYFQDGHQLSDMYRLLDEVKPIIKESDQTNIFKLAYKAIVSIYDKHGAKSDSEKLFDQIEEHLEDYQSRRAR